MSIKTIHICDLCGEEDEKITTFYEDRLGAIYESIAWGDGEDFKRIDVCSSCLLRFVTEGIRCHLKG